MSSDTWGAAAHATAMWFIAGGAVLSGDITRTRPDGSVWTAASSEKIASHPTLIRRSNAVVSTRVRTAALDQRQ